MRTEYIQQGDILLFPKGHAKFPKGIPSTAAEIKDRTVVQEGEHTGHAHRLADKKKAVLCMAGALLMMRVYKETEMLHEEHRPAPLWVDEYLVERKREFDPFTEETRRVQD